MVNVSYKDVYVSLGIITLRMSFVLKNSWLKPLPHRYLDQNVGHMQVPIKNANITKWS